MGMKFPIKRCESIDGVFPIIWELAATGLRNRVVIFVTHMVVLCVWRDFSLVIDQRDKALLNVQAENEARRQDNRMGLEIYRVIGLFSTSLLLFRD